MDLTGQTFYSINVKENIWVHIMSCICTAPCFLGNKAIAHLWAEINWCISFGFRQTWGVWSRTQSQMPSAHYQLWSLELCFCSAFEKIAKAWCSLGLRKISSDSAVTVWTWGQAGRATIGPLCPGSQQSHMHPWVLMCSHLGRKEISASHCSTFCWLHRDDQKSENRNSRFGLFLTDQLQVWREPFWHKLMLLHLFPH